MKLLIKLLLTISLLANLAYAAKKPSKTADKPSVGVGIGLTDYTGYDSGYSLMLNTSKPLPDVASNFGAEAVFSTTIIDPSLNNTDLSITALAAYATWYFDLNPEISIKPKVGLAYGRYATGATDDTDISLSYGFKTAYALKENKALYLDYTIIDSDLGSNVSILSFGMLFPF